MWKTIYIASDITLANSLKKKLKKKGIKTILNILDMEKEELNGNVEILVLKSESAEAFNLISEIIICENN
ncbi:MAG: hypothetical protein U9N08_02030 [Candidatus Caldatribacteriota bacterium]|nr:hypothetical protein [Candidatus Caldatribacteriota bacterium]